MGYTTDFEGDVTVEPPLNAAEIQYLDRFAETRRMDRDHGPYYVEGSGDFGQGGDPDIRNFNTPPDDQPGLWCQWVPTPDGTAIVWDGGEKFYHAEAWMKYIIQHFLQPKAHASKVDDEQFAEFTFDHILNGEIYAQGEEANDTWKLIVRDNEVLTAEAQVSWNQARPVV